MPTFCEYQTCLNTNWFPDRTLRRRYAITRNIIMVHPGWFWVICGRFGFCFHKAPMAIAPLVIRWGADVSSDRLRRCARCTICGHKGATLQAPSWYDGVTGHQPFPVDAAKKPI